MKAQRNEEKQFNPVILTLETQHEVDALAAIFRHGILSENILNIKDGWDLIARYEKNSDEIFDRLRTYLTKGGL